VRALAHAQDPESGRERASEREGVGERGEGKDGILSLFQVDVLSLYHLEQRDYGLGFRLRVLSTDVSSTHTGSIRDTENTSRNTHTHTHTTLTGSIRDTEDTETARTVVDPRTLVAKVSMEASAAAACSEDVDGEGEGEGTGSLSSWHLCKGAGAAALKMLSISRGLVQKSQKS
jgi:hypothetical protein